MMNGIVEVARAPVRMDRIEIESNQAQGQVVRHEAIRQRHPAL